MWRVVLVLCLGCALSVPLDKTGEADGFDESFPEENPGLFQGDIELRPGQNPHDRTAYRNRQYRWPSGVVPYIIDSRLTSSEKSIIHKAMQTIQSLTKKNGRNCITFKPHTHESAYIRYQGGSGCHTPVGYHHSVTGVTLGRGCYRIGTAMHETLHALGFWHEQSRPDRDSYVTINWSNIQRGHEHNFDKLSNSMVDELGLSYDYDSVMHYGAYSFAVDRSKPTISVKHRGASIGQRSHLSHNDIKMVQLYYGC